MIEPGGWAVCVDARASGGELRRGEVYRVAEVYGTFYRLDGWPPKHGWFAFRFRPAPKIDGLRAFLSTPAGNPAHQGV